MEFEKANKVHKTMDKYKNQFGKYPNDEELEKFYNS